MKTTLSRMKTLALDNMGQGNTLSYVKDVEVLHPEIELTTITIPTIPKILLTPQTTSEEWVASQKKSATHMVIAYLMMMYHQRESSIMGDPTRGTQGKGILDFVADFLTVFRGHRLSAGGVIYLDKPLDILNVEYADPIVYENGHLIVAAVSMQCSRLFLQTTLPGDV